MGAEEIAVVIVDAVAITVEEEIAAVYERIHYSVEMLRVLSADEDETCGVELEARGGRSPRAAYG